MNVIEEYEQSSPAATKLVAIALHALGARALVWMAFIGATALWALAMVDPTVLKLITAGGYCATVLAPILIRDAKGG